MRDILQTEVSRDSVSCSRHQEFKSELVFASLPEDVASARQDSAIEANLLVQEHHRSSCPDTLGWPGCESAFLKETGQDSVPMFYEEVLFPVSFCDHPEIDFRHSGMVSEPVPYMMRNDDGITSVLLFCFLMNMFIFIRGKKQIRQKVLDFFNNRINHDILFPIATGREMRHALFLCLQTGLLVALFAFNYTLSVCDMFMAPVTHFQLLGIYVLCCWAYWGVKHLLYSFVNWIFFDKYRRMAWMKSYSSLLSAEGLLLFPLALVTVYFNFSINHVILCLCLLLGMIKVLLFYKTFSFFFPKIHGILHLIAYLCALEMMPVCILWKALMLMNKILL